MGAGAKPYGNGCKDVSRATPNPDVSVTATGCLGFCRAGPLMVVYPEGVWYVPRTEKDIDEILPSHFVEGNPVERLIIVPIP